MTAQNFIHSYGNNNHNYSTNDHNNGDIQKNVSKDREILEIKPIRGRAAFERAIAILPDGYR